jgi:hypothetical protein
LATTRADRGRNAGAPSGFGSWKHETDLAIGILLLFVEY